MQRLDLDALTDGAAPRGRTDPRRVIPDLALPVQGLRGFDAALALSVQALRAGGLDWRGVETRLALQAGRATVQPFAATIPGGRISGSLTLDGAASPPATALSLRSEGTGIDLAALGRALGRGGAVLAGPAEIALELRGRGATLRGVAATLTGEAGLAVVEGSLAWAQMLRVGPDLGRALLGAGAPVQEGALRCVALRLSAEAGLVQSQALLVEGAFGRIEGSLALNLRDETLAARLLPDLTVLGGLTLRPPVSIGGTLAAPRVGVEPAAALAQVIGDTVANRLWRSSTVEWLRGSGRGPAPSGTCEAELRLARLDRPGRPPQPMAATVPLVPRELQGAARGAQDAVEGAARGAGTVVEGVARGTGAAVEGVARGTGAALEGVARGTGAAVEGVARGTQDVLRGIGGVLGSGGLLSGSRR
jgi:hypothetical protein